MRRLPGPELFAILSILRGLGHLVNDPSTCATAFIINGFRRTGLAEGRNIWTRSGRLDEAPLAGVLNGLGYTPFGFAISPAGFLIVDSSLRGRWARSSTKRYPQATFRIPGRHFWGKFFAGGPKPWSCVERVPLRVNDAEAGFRRRDADGCDRDGRAPLFLP